MRISISALLVVCLAAIFTQSAAPGTRPTDGAVAVVRADTGAVALTNVRVIDGTGAPPKENQTIVVEQGRIRAVGNDGTVPIPPGARIRDLVGRTVMPGLVMLHEHLEYVGADDFSHPQLFSAPRLFLAYGVTTIRTAGTDHPYMQLNLKRQIDSGEVPGPEMFITSPFLNGAGSRFLGDKVVRDAEDARRAVRYWAAEGVTSFKVYRQISREALAAIIDEAHRLQLPVTAHLESVTCREAVELGIDNLEHAFGPCTRRTADSLGTDANGPRAQAFIRLLIEKDVVLTFTPIDRDRPLSELELKLFHPELRESYNRTQARAVVSSAGPDSGLTTLQGQLTMAFVREGGRLVLGSDPLCCDAFRMAGVANHDAIRIAARIGFTPLEVIRMATLGGATFLGIQHRVGSIAVGKEADLLVVRGDPSRRIEDIDAVEIVFVNGIAYEPSALLSEVEGQVGWK